MLRDAAAGEREAGLGERACEFGQAGLDRLAGRGHVGAEVDARLRAVHHDLHRDRAHVGRVQVQLGGLHAVFGEHGQAQAERCREIGCAERGGDGHGDRRCAGGAGVRCRRRRVSADAGGVRGSVERRVGPRLRRSLGRALLGQRAGELAHPGRIVAQVPGVCGLVFRVGIGFRFGGAPGLGRAERFVAWRPGCVGVQRRIVGRSRQRPLQAGEPGRRGRLAGDGLGLRCVATLGRRVGSSHAGGVAGVAGAAGVGFGRLLARRGRRAFGGAQLAFQRSAVALGRRVRFVRCSGLVRRGVGVRRLVRERCRPGNSGCGRRGRGLRLAQQRGETGRVGRRVRRRGVARGMALRVAR